MSTAVATSERSLASWGVRAADYMELTRIRICVMVMIAVLVAGLLGSWGQPDPIALLAAVLGTSLVAASASMFNQWLERERDARMPRTADRPLPSRRVGSFEVLAVGSLSVAAGTAILYWGAGAVPAALGAGTWLAYVFIYTPMKAWSAWNTWIGAVPGAMPVAIGWLAAGGRADVRLLTLWLVLFLWQFPHFMAIAWIYRKDYAQGGLRMLTVTEPSGIAAGAQAVACALALIPVSLITVLDLTRVMTTSGAIICGYAVLAAGLIQFGLAVRFMHDRDDPSARHLLHASLVYLPVVLLTFALGPLL